MSDRLIYGRDNGSVTTATHWEHEETWCATSTWGPADKENAALVSDWSDQWWSGEMTNDS